MTYRVTWDLSAIDELQRIYDDALDKEGVVNAVKRIGLELAAVPLEATEFSQHIRGWILTNSFPGFLIPPLRKSLAKHRARRLH